MPSVQYQLSVTDFAYKMEINKCFHFKTQQLVVHPSKFHCNCKFLRGCLGGDTADIWSYFASSGVVTANCLPYNIPPCVEDDTACNYSENVTATPPCNTNCAVPVFTFLIFARLVTIKLGQTTKFM